MTLTIESMFESAKEFLTINIGAHVSYSYPQNHGDSTSEHCHKFETNCHGSTRCKEISSFPSCKRAVATSLSSRVEVMN